jgi:hypothetical protein
MSSPRASHPHAVLRLEQDRIQISNRQIHGTHEAIPFCEKQIQTASSCLQHPRALALPWGREGGGGGVSGWVVGESGEAESPRQRMGGLSATLRHSHVGVGPGGLGKHECLPDLGWGAVRSSSLRAIATPMSVLFCSSKVCAEKFSQQCTANFMAWTAAQVHTITPIELAGYVRFVSASDDGNQHGACRLCT